MADSSTFVALPRASLASGLRRPAGCDDIIQEKASPSKDRAPLQQLLTRLRAGDTLVVWKLARLGRSLNNLVMLVMGFQQQGIHFVSLPDHLDTTTAQGRLLFNLVASLAEFERDIIRECTKARLTAARGRPKGFQNSPLESPSGPHTLSAARQNRGRNRPATRRGPGHDSLQPRAPRRSYERQSEASWGSRNFSLRCNENPYPTKRPVPASSRGVGWPRRITLNRVARWPF
jgi:hypothetical protein